MLTLSFAYHQYYNYLYVLYGIFMFWKNKSPLFLKENGNLWCFGTFKYGVATQHNPSPGHSMLVYAISKSLFDCPIVKIACGWTHCLVQSGNYKEVFLLTVFFYTYKL